jgi:hypothetical protein
MLATYLWMASVLAAFVALAVAVRQWRRSRAVGVRASAAA